MERLINQRAGGPQGNPAPIYYQLASAEYGSTGNSACNSSNGPTASAVGCIFYDVTFGDMGVDCVGPNCYLADGTVGVLSTSDSAFLPAYGTNTGWDFATGIGTVNAANLVNNWPSATGNFSLSASPAGLTVTQGSSSGPSTISITPQHGFSGSASFTASGLPNGVTANFNPPTATGSSTLTFTASATATIGTASVTITGSSGSLTHQTQVTLTVNPAGNFTLSASPNSVSILPGGNASSSIAVNPLNGFNGNVTFSAFGLPNGVTANFNPASSATSSTLTFAAGSSAAAGTYNVTVTGICANLINSTAIPLTITLGPDFSLSGSPNSLSITRGSHGSSTISITPLNGFTGAVRLSASGLPARVSASFNPNPATTSSKLTLTVGKRASTGTRIITITGTSGGLQHSMTVSLTIH